MEDATPSLVSIHSSLPLLPRKLVQQINAGVFVDLADLLPARHRQSGSFPTEMLSPLGLLQLQDMERCQRLIPGGVSVSPFMQRYWVQVNLIGSLS